MSDSTKIEQSDEIIPAFEEETETELLRKLQSSEIDIDEFVTRSIRKTENNKNGDAKTNSANEVAVADVYTVNSKLLPSLTENFQPDIPQEIQIPDFTSLTPKEAVECLGEMTGITDHEINFISFWTLDTLAGCLQKLQNKGIETKSQKAFIAWFGFLLKTLSVHGWAREESFLDFKKLILTAKERMEKENSEIPLPIQCLEMINRLSIVGSQKSKTSETRVPSRGSSIKTSLSKRKTSSKALKSDKSKSSSTIKSNTVESNENLHKNLTDLELIAEFIYAIFADRFKFEVIKRAFTSASNITTVHLPHPLHVPKCLEPPPVVASKKTKDKKGKKGKSKGKKDKSPPVVEEKQEIVLSDQYILPLSKATEVDKNFFAALFPEKANANAKKSPKGKGKGKGKKKK